MLLQEQLADTVKLMKHARKVKNKEEAKLCIAVLGSCSIQFFVQAFRYVLEQRGIEANLYEGEFNGISMDVLDENSALYEKKPDIVILLTDYRDVKALPGLLATETEVERSLEEAISYYQRLWKHLEQIEGVHVFQSNFVIPDESQLGNLECNYTFSRTLFLQQLNIELAKKRPSYVNLVDLERLAGKVGKDSWFDATGYFSYKLGFSMDYIGYVADLFARQVEALTGKTKKCLVLDLDNTLWGGVVGDVGWEHIQLDVNDAVGEAFQTFQEYVLRLKERGVILAVCSKNEEENAKEAFKLRPEMKIKLEDISCFVANWKDKAENLITIANTLNIGMDSLVFFDDNPAERARVKQAHPEVYVVDVPEEPEGYIRAMEEAHPFEWIQITKEDLGRTNTYVQNNRRMQYMEAAESYEDFLISLEMQGTVREVKKEDVPRFAQLINKSNQFNLRTQRYTEAQIERFCESEQYKCLAMLLKDKFDEYGIVSCVILKKEKDICFIDTWLMSCRVLKRGVENFVFESIVKKAIEMGCSTLQGEYIQTRKNGMVTCFYEKLGFTCIEESEDSEKAKVKKYELPRLQTRNYAQVKNNTYIERIETWN